MHRYESEFCRLVASATNLPAESFSSLIRTPEPEKGDLSIPCFPLAKQLRGNPAGIAANIAQTMETSPYFTSIVAEGPYLNARISSLHLASTLISEIRTLGDRFCHSEDGAGQTMVIDYSSPNIAKPLGFHHLRSTMIGHSLVRIHRARGFRVVGINFLGDWGKTFGLLAQAYLQFGNEEELAKGKIAYLLELYVKGTQAAKEDPVFNEAARAMFCAQEAGDSASMALWEHIRSISIAEFRKIYARLGVSFEAYEGESSYRDNLESVIAEIEKTAGTRVDQGALILNMPYAEGEAPLMLKKSDGATLYATRDIAAAMDRYDRYHYTKSLYVVGSEQRLHFNQLKRGLQAMNRPGFENMVHVEFGRVQGMSTRKGTVVFLEEVLDEAKERAKEKMLASQVEREMDIETVSEQVGIGGIVFGDLKNLRTSDYTFDWEELLNPRGFTGICVQYAHARCCSILRKGGGAPPVGDPIDWSLLSSDEEIALIKELARLPAAVEAAENLLEPSRVARAVYDAAHAWNRYQQSGNADKTLRILIEDENLRKARLALVDATRIGLYQGLELLGVPQPTAM